MPKEAVLFVNLRSRRGAEWFPSARELLSQGNLDLKAAEGFRDPNSLLEAVKKAIEAKVPLVVVGSGDGTLGLVAKYFIGSESILGVLPLGTGNSLARDLGIKPEVEAACEVLTKGRVARIDLGKINDEYFVNVASIGLSTRIASELTVQNKRRFGRLSYGFAVCRALFEFKPFDVTIETREGKETLRALQLVIGCGKFHAGPFPLSPNASITDGRLNLYAVADCSTWALFKYALFLPGGRFTQLQEVASAAVEGGRIDAVPPKRVTVDGEIKLTTPFTFGIAPGALPVMVPADFER